MDKMFNVFETLCDYEEVPFDAKNQRVHCLAHIINLAAQNILKSLKEEAPNNEIEVLEQNISNTTGVVSKVKIYYKFFYISFLAIYIYIINLFINNYLYFLNFIL